MVPEAEGLDGKRAARRVGGPSRRFCFSALSPPPPSPSKWFRELDLVPVPFWFAELISEQVRRLLGFGVPGSWRPCTSTVTSCGSLMEAPGMWKCGRVAELAGAGMTFIAFFAEWNVGSLSQSTLRHGCISTDGAELGEVCGCGRSLFDWWDAGSRIAEPKLCCRGLVDGRGTRDP